MKVTCFSALQRAEIAEIHLFDLVNDHEIVVSVLFNEPKLLKFTVRATNRTAAVRFSALQRAEIAEINGERLYAVRAARVSVLFNEPKLLKCRLPAF